METHDQERLGCMEEHQLSSGDQKENIFQNGDLSYQKGEMSQNTCLKIPFQGKQTEMPGKSNTGVGDFQDIVVLGRTSLGQNPYKSTVCSESFSHSSDLLQHPRSHTMKKAYQCMQCEKGFSSMTALIQHQAVYRGKCVLVCPNCDDRFTYGSYFALHWRVHKREKRLVCTQCRWLFSSASELLAHLALHV